MEITKETYIYDIDTKKIFGKLQIGSTVYVGLGRSLFEGTIQEAISKGFLIDENLEEL